MTRRSKRELKRAFEEFSGSADRGDVDVGVVHEHPETGAWYATSALEERVAPDRRPAHGDSRTRRGESEVRRA